uniref:Uncharacterized protein n=1 Tax=Oryza meridionalis TaxID=40149 RepID=A0A0E0FEK9_9ORYZ
MRNRGSIARREVISAVRDQRREQTAGAESIAPSPGCGDYSEGAVLIWNGEGKEVVNIQWINDCYIQGIKIPENDAVAIQALIKTPATCQGARDTIVSASK